MNNFVGIDLGTTNSAICSYDGETLKLYKSPEQNDVTPSAIFIDRRGNKYTGLRAYDAAARSPESGATLFKRLMGTGTPINLPAVNLTLTPEDCSAEILRLLFGYLPEEIRNDPETGTVITVPAAFNQMQKDSTMSAASIAGLGKVALMQEPVAAVMSVMRQRNADGLFLVYDLGGGTLDIAIAQSISGRVSLLAHGGIAMCGGRDFDRLLLDNIIKPWLIDKFELNDNFVSETKYKPLLRLAAWAAEKAKIELSAKDDAIIQLYENELLGIKDLSGKEIYLEISINRNMFDQLISQKVDDSVITARETMNKAGLSSHDVERIVFIGGPTYYKSLRDKVAYSLGIAASTDVNPMTAVAEGAAVFAESIDWSSQHRGRKNSRGVISTSGNINVSFGYISRTPDSKAKIIAEVDGNILEGAAFQVDSLDTGWSSGRIALKHGAALSVSLTKPGENTFKVFVFDANGGPIALENHKIVITRTAASIDAIPSSSSVGIEVLDKLGGRSVLDYLVREGDALPKKGQKIFKSTESLRAQGPGSINFKIWEGEIDHPIDDNRYIGVLSIKGTDFDDGVISAGTELVCDFEILDSGNVTIEVSVPSIGGTFHSGRNFYSRQEGQIDYTSASKRILDDAERMKARIEAMSDKVEDSKLDQALTRVNDAAALKTDEGDPETAKQAMDNILEAKKLLAIVRRDHLKEIRQLDLDASVKLFNDHLRQHARPAEIASFENLVRTAQRSIDNNTVDFDNNIDELRNKNWQILWRQDWFVVDKFKMYVDSPHLFEDKQRYQELVALGLDATVADDIERLRSIVHKLYLIKVGTSLDDDIFASANIVRG